jgi:ribosome-binding factor A
MQINDMESTRQNKISKQLQKDLSEILNQHAKQLATGKMLTVTKVRVTADLSIAKSYVSVFPSSDAENIIKNLNTHVNQLRHELAQKIRHQVRKIPEIKFFLDDSMDYIQNIDNLLKE